MNTRKGEDFVCTENGHLKWVIWIKSSACRYDNGIMATSTLPRAILSLYFLHYLYLYLNLIRKHLVHAQFYFFLVYHYIDCGIRRSKGEMILYIVVQSKTLPFHITLSLCTLSESSGLLRELAGALNPRSRDWCPRGTGTPLTLGTLGITHGLRSRKSYFISIAIRSRVQHTTK